MSRGLPPGLLLITDRNQACGPLPGICRAAVDAGFTAVMVREKDLPARPLLELALEIEPVCRGRCAFLINDRVDVALTVPGAGVHLGWAGLPVEDARALLGPDRLVGYSAHEPGEARAALDRGADYVTLSPIFPSRSKPELAPRGLGFLDDALAALPGDRVVALGGIDATALSEVASRPVGGAAVMGAVMAADDPTRAAIELVRVWTGVRR